MQLDDAGSVVENSFLVEQAGTYEVRLEATERGSNGQIMNGYVGIQVEANQPPIPVLKFNTRPPTSPLDYPYDDTHSSPLSLKTGLKLYVSGAESYDPEGEDFEVHWTVTAPDNTTVELDELGTSIDNSYTPDQAGSYYVRLEVTELGLVGQSSSTQLDFVVA